MVFSGELTRMWPMHIPHNTYANHTPKIKGITSSFGPQMYVPLSYTVLKLVKKPQLPLLYLLSCALANINHRIQSREREDVQEYRTISICKLHHMLLIISSTLNLCIYMILNEILKFCWYFHLDTALSWGSPVVMLYIYCQNICNAAVQTLVEL